MQYHFHLIRNILKLPYCFPLETPSPPKSDNQAGGCQGPSVLGRVCASGTKVTKNGLTDPSMPPGVQETAHGSQQDPPGPGQGWGGIPQVKGKGEGPREACRMGWVRWNLPRSFLLVWLGSRTGQALYLESPFPPPPQAASQGRGFLGSWLARGWGGIRPGDPQHLRKSRRPPT